jgi:fructose-bisphosphate aldolase, class II
LNADHTHSLAHAMDVARAGFDSIVFDLSALPFEENVRQTKEVVQALKGVNPAILVEGEIGDIGTGSEIHEKAPDLSKGLTSPAQAKEFVQSTGIDILAPAVGNMHGMLKSMVQGQARKRLDIERIAEIKRAVQIPLTLHGGSGTDDEDLRKAITAGINIVHNTRSCGSHGGGAWRKASTKNPTRSSPIRSCRLRYSRSTRSPARASRFSTAWANPQVARRSSGDGGGPGR